MQKFTINLLPEEFRIEELKRAKFYRIQSIGVAIILLMIFLSTMTVALRILQSKSISYLQAKFGEEEKKITDLKNTQVSLLLLKNRLTTINQYFGVSSKQAQMYKLINQIFPSSVQVTSLGVNRLGDTVILATVSDVATIDDLLKRLTSNETNYNKISQVSIESLSRGQDGTYRINLKVKPL